MKLAKIKGSLTCFSTIYSGTHRKLIPCFLVEDNCPVPNEDPTKYHISVPLGYGMIFQPVVSGLR